MEMSEGGFDDVPQSSCLLPDHIANSKADTFKDAEKKVPKNMKCNKQLE